MVVKALEINYIEGIEIDVLFRLPWSCLCSKTCTPARTIGCSPTYALIFYYLLMSRPVVPLIKHRMADISF